jgi:hypothetical protein
MWFHSALAVATCGLTSTRRDRRPQPSRRVQPCLEAIEDRCVPSALSLTSNLSNIMKTKHDTLSWAVNDGQVDRRSMTVDVHYASSGTGGGSGKVSYQDATPDVLATLPIKQTPATVDLHQPSALATTMGTYTVRFYND